MAETPLSAQNPRQKLKDIAVLILHGSMHSADLFKNILTQLGFTNLIIACDAADGARVIKGQRIDLVVVDWELRLAVTQVETDDTISVGGAVFTQRLRHATSSPDPFVPVMITLDSEIPAHTHTARDNGVSEIVTKPVLRVDEFCAKLQRLFDQPRPFIRSNVYKGPCRRRGEDKATPEQKDRRLRTVRMIKHPDYAEGA